MNVIRFGVRGGGQDKKSPATSVYIRPRECGA